MPTLVQIIGCRLKTAPTHYLNQYWIIVNWIHRNNYNEISIKNTHFHWMKCIWKCRLRNVGRFFSASMCKASVHDDVIKWKHFPRYWPFVRGIHRWPVNSPHKGQWRGALMFSLICAWIKDWVNNREAGDLWRSRGHYDVTVMVILCDETHLSPWEVMTQKSIGPSITVWNGSENLNY